MSKVILMDIKDKIKIENNGCCPPHYLPHKLPFGKTIDDEPCHTHNAKWRRCHHDFYCKVLNCPNYKVMKEKTAELIKK
jgi:hypothetical protein